MKKIKLDPNLEKFIETNYADIMEGKINTVVTQAKDYLFKVASPYQASRELAQFVSHVRRLPKTNE
jgi:pyridoxal biosynthesis lyase PdxS